MSRKVAASAIKLIRRGISAKSCREIGNFSHPLSFYPSNFHNLSHNDRLGSTNPRIDFSSINDVDDAISLFRKMLIMSPQPSVRAYNKLLSGVAKMEEYSLALYMFDEMRHSSFPMNEFTMNIVINCFCHLNRVDLGFAVMGSFLKRDHKPNVATFNTLLRGLFLVGNVAEAEALFKKVLFSKLCQPDGVMILVVVNGLCKSGQTHKARNLLWDFEKTGYKPYVCSYNAVIDGLCKDGMVDDARHLLLEMSNNGIQSNVVTYNTIIHGLCEDGRVDDALHILFEMPDKGIQPNVVTYTTITHGLCEYGRIDDALHILFEMPDKGIQPNVVTHNTITHGLCEYGRIDDALHILFEMPDKGIQPNVVTYNTITHGLCEYGRIDDALQLLSEMHQKLIRPNVVTYNTIIRGLCEKGRVDDALHVLSEMPDKLIRPDVVTYTTIIQGLCKGERIDDALHLLFEMPDKLIQPNVVTYNTITHGLFEDGRIDDALQLIFGMPEKGIRPNIVTYKTIIHGYAQHGFMTEALQLYDSMLRNGIKPDGATFHAVLSSCAHVGALEEALYHFGSMTKDFGITPGLDHLACLVTLYAREGETKTAYDLVRNFPCAPDKVVWKCLLSGCVKNKDLELARLAAKEILSIDPNDASAHVMLSNVYASLNMWEEVFKVRELMKEKKVKKERGCSWI